MLAGALPVLIHLCDFTLARTDHWHDSHVGSSTPQNCGAPGS
ncbi:MAG TPA: hypothetical protein VIM74_07800 [Casimicrobiaceae bacterium]